MGGRKKAWRTMAVKEGKGSERWKGQQLDMIVVEVARNSMDPRGGEGRLKFARFPNGMGCKADRSQKLQRVVFPWDLPCAATTEQPWCGYLACR